MVLITAVLLLTINSYSQSDKQDKGKDFSQEKGFIAITGGGGAPINEFASTNPDKESSGYAKTGWFGDISLNSKFGNGNIGLALLVRYQQNKQDATAYLKKTLYGTSATGAISQNLWIIKGYLVGLHGSFPVGAYAGQTDHSSPI